MWFGVTWSLELYQQTNARLWRQGQKAGNVVIRHLISKGTIDERIMAALERKNTTQAALKEAVKGRYEEEQFRHALPAEKDGTHRWPHL